jgi:hypothetical protein
LETAQNLGQAVANALIECKIIAPGGTVVVEKERATEKMLAIQLQNASMHDQSVFNKSMEELLAPIEKPRYLIIPKRCSKKQKYRFAFACPSVIGKTKDFTKVLEWNLEKVLGDMKLIYTGNGEGSMFLHRCKTAQYKEEYIDVEEELPLLKADTKYIVVKSKPQLLLEDKGASKTK